jgi:hypothetical protein
MGIKYYVKAAVSEFADKDGQPKKRYQTIGIVTETKKGDLMIKIEMLPMLSMKEGAVWGYLNVPEDKAEGQKPAANLATMEDDPPF